MRRADRGAKSDGLGVILVGIAGGVRAAVRVEHGLYDALGLDDVVGVQALHELGVGAAR